VSPLTEARSARKGEGGLVMEERGRVVDIKGELAVVEMEKTGRAGCGSCCLCKKNAGGRFFLEAVNSAGAKKGDTVTVEIDDTSILRGIFFVYGVPLAGFMLGITASYFLKNVVLKIAVFLVILGFFWQYGLRKGNEEGKKSRAKIAKEIK